MAKVGRKSIRTFFKIEIARLALTKKWGRKRIYLHLVEKALTDPAYADYPSEDTVKKYIRTAKSPEFKARDLMKEFHYPNDAGQGDAKIPWGLARYAMDCLGFYFENYGTRPSIGLAKRYAEVATLCPPLDSIMKVREEPPTLSIEERQGKKYCILNESTTGVTAKDIVIMAEKFWYSDLVAAWDGESKRPSTEYNEIELALACAVDSNLVCFPPFSDGKERIEKIAQGLTDEKT